MEVWLAEIKLRVRRRVGEISRELEKMAPQESGALSGRPSGGTTSKSETLRAARLSRSVANRCEQIGAISEAAYARQAREMSGDITT